MSNQKNIVPLLCLLLSILKCRILWPWDLPTISNRILDATDHDRTEKDLTAHKFYKVLLKKTTRFWSTTRTQASNRDRMNIRLQESRFPYLHCTIFTICDNQISVRVMGYTNHFFVVNLWAKTMQKLNRLL